MARIRNEVLPDLAIYRSQLSNLFPKVWAPLSRSHRSAGVGTPEADPLLRVVLGLSRASAQLAAYLEPREHGAASPVSQSKMWLSVLSVRSSRMIGASGASARRTSMTGSSRSYSTSMSSSASRAE